MKKLLFLIPLSLVAACGKEQEIAHLPNKSRTIEEKLDMIYKKQMMLGRASSDIPSPHSERSGI